MLQKVQTFVEHRNRAYSISFNADISATIAADNQLIVHLISDPEHHKMLLKKPLEEGAEINNNSLVAVYKVEKQKASDQVQIYAAVSHGFGFKVWHLQLDQRGETVQTGPTEVLDVPIAHNSEIITLMQFARIQGEGYLTTGAGLD